MRAATFTRTGTARDVLHVGDVPVPEPAAGEVRVRIVASGVNPSDVKRRNASPGAPPEFPVVIPHSDGAGTIDAVGSGVAASRIGERVWLYNAQYGRAGGTAAEYTTVPEAMAIPLPDDVDFAIGACLGVPALTAYHAVMLDGSLHGQHVLIQGGAGAVAFYAIQFAKTAGATVIATVSSDEKAAVARRAGADHIVNYRRESLADRVRELTGGTGVDRIIEVDLAANGMSYPALIKRHGKAVVYGSGAPEIKIPNRFIALSTTLEFFVVYDLLPEERARANAALDAALRDGSLQHHLGQRFPLERIVEAHECVEAGSNGNVIVEP